MSCRTSSDELETLEWNNIYFIIVRKTTILLICNRSGPRMLVTLQAKGNQPPAAFIVSNAIGMW